MTYRQKREEAWAALPQDERAALEALADCAAPGEREKAEELAQSVAVARYRRARKARLNAAADSRRRVLVGARVPRDLAREVAQYARDNGMSVYSFVRQALEDALW